MNRHFRIRLRAAFPVRSVRSGGMFSRPPPGPRYISRLCLVAVMLRCLRVSPRDEDVSQTAINVPHLSFTKVKRTQIPPFKRFGRWHLADPNAREA